MKKNRKEVVISDQVDEYGTRWIETQGTSNRFLLFYGNFLTWLGSKLIGWGEPYATYYEMVIEDEDDK